MEKGKKVEFVYNTDNFGTCTVSHVQRIENEKGNIDCDTFAIHAEKGAWIGNVAIPLDTKPATALKIIFDFIDALDYSGE